MGLLKKAEDLARREPDSTLPGWLEIWVDALLYRVENLDAVQSHFDTLFSKADLDPVQLAKIEDDLRLAHVEFVEIRDYIDSLMR